MPQAAQVLPTALPAPGGRGAWRQHGPVLFNVEIKGLYELGDVPLVLPCWLAEGPWLRVHTWYTLGV